MSECGAVGAINPTLIGSLDIVAAGNFEMACTKVPGRYHVPWGRK